VDNYPDNWSWSAYDDYHDPKLECGHNSSDGCNCWCEHYLPNRQHIVGECHASNCALYLCKHCGVELSDEQVDKACDNDEEQACVKCLAEEEEE